MFRPWEEPFSIWRPWEGSQGLLTTWRPWEDTEEDTSCYRVTGNDIDKDSSTGNEFKPDLRNCKKPYLHLNEQAKQICLNVYNNLVKDTAYKGNGTVIEKAAQLTGVPYSTMCQLVRQGNKKRRRRSDVGKLKEIDPAVAKHLRNVVYEKYKNNEIPTIDTIRNTLIESGKTYTSTTLKRWLKKLGFKFKIVDKRVAIMESTRIVRWRLDYLDKIKIYREHSRPIYYLDETWYDTHDSAKKGWTDGTTKCQLKGVPPNRGSRLIILHCGSADGWVTNGLKLCGKKIQDCNVDYHKNMESQIFEEWFEHTLIPNLKPSSVIVMDNASYHSRQSIKIPNASSSKEEIKNYLVCHDLYFEESYTKTELLEVLRTMKIEKKYVIDLIAARHGHTVLRLPPYFCVFNPIELIWGQIKPRIRRKNIFPKFDKKVVDLIQNEILQITEEDWNRCIQKVIKIEEEYRSLSRIHTNSGDKFIINLQESEEENLHSEEESKDSRDES